MIEDSAYIRASHTGPMSCACPYTFGIVFGKITSLLSTLLTNTVPPFDISTLIFMVLGGILGGMAGRAANKRLDNTAVDKLFIGLMAVIIGINVYNVWQYWVI